MPQTCPNRGAKSLNRTAVMWGVKYNSFVLCVSDSIVCMTALIGLVALTFHLLTSK